VKRLRISLSNDDANYILPSKAANHGKLSDPGFNYLAASWKPEASC